MSNLTLNSDTSQSAVKGSSFFRRGALAVGGLVAAAALALGGASAANAAVTSGHNDIVALNSSGTVGSYFGSTFDAWPVAAGYEEFQFTKSASPTNVTCVGGVYTIKDTNGSAIPSVGFTNEKRGTSLPVSLTADGDDVSFASTGIGSFNIYSDGPSAGLSGHHHGTWTLDNGAPCVGTGQTATFNLTFTTTSPAATEDFVFKITL